MTEICSLCGDATADGARWVLVQGKRRQAHCSERCLRETIRRRQQARKATRRRWLIGSSSVLLLLTTAGWAWRRFRLPPAQSISYDVTDTVIERPGTEPTIYGPPWPPSDEYWEWLFARVPWVHPLPGPRRRTPVSDGRVFGPPPPHEQRPVCRTEGKCGVDLGGELWGEHVYAALDGVVDRVQVSGNEKRGGIYVRLAHFGGMVFTQYFHLAATRRSVARGAHIKAGEVVGLLGDTGLRNEPRHLHFALSVRPSSQLVEVYWDPTPLMDRFALRVPPNGTVAGYDPPEVAQKAKRRRRSR